MNMEKLCQLYTQGRRVACWVGGRNILFFGLLGTALALE